MPDSAATAPRCRRCLAAAGNDQHTPAASFQGCCSLVDGLIANVVQILDLLWNLLQEFRREDAQKLPCDVQGCEDVTVLVLALRQELLFKLLCELKILMLVFAKRLLAHNSLHSTCILTNGVVGIHLIRHIGVI